MDDEEEPELTEEQLTEVRERSEVLEDVARKIGLYQDHVHVAMVPTPFGPKPAIVAHFRVGDIAFTPRVQDPEQEFMNHQFESLTTELEEDTFAEEQARMKKNLEAGRDPLDDGED